MTQAHQFSFTSISGVPMPLSQFAGKAVLVVNTASKCGYTPQYEGLEALYREYAEDGLVVLGVPCNQFGGQEPGTESEIKDFCEVNYRISFPLTARTEVAGPNAHPFYRWVRDELGEGAEPKWNFHKVLIAASGELADVFPSKVTPDAPEMIRAIHAALPK